MKKKFKNLRENMLKKFFKWFFILTISLVFISYLFFAVFLKWNNIQAKNSTQFDKSIYANLREPHFISTLNDGEVSLAARLELIENAKKTIELEFFIYDLDLASKIITKKLIQKAKEGVNVRLLIDFSLPVFKFRPIYAHFLKRHGIEVKYYNTSSVHQIFSVQHRSHRKLLIVDGEKFITGGRNVANDYFNLSKIYNFLDSDILVEGPITKTVLNSFNLYWNSKFAKSENSDELKNKIEILEAKKFTSINKEDLILFEIVDKYKKNKLDNIQKFECENITFVTDFPGVEEKNRRVYQVLSEKLLNSKSNIIAETPYFVLREDGFNLIKKISENNINLKVLTNGLYSTDAYYTVSALIPWLSNLENTTIELLAYNGTSPNLSSDFPIKRSNRFGIHSKRAVIDDNTTIIGTYNVDPRSANLNSELIVICEDNPLLALNIKSDIENRIKNSDHVINKNFSNFSNLIKNSTFEQKVKLFLALPLASLFNFLL